MRFRYEKSLSTMVVFGVLMSSSALHANNIYFSEDGLINLENSSLHADGDLNGVVMYHVCGGVLISNVKVFTASHCVRHLLKKAV